METLAVTNQFVCIQEREADGLTVSSIFGSAKVTQEADNILILQDKRLTSIRGRKFIQVSSDWLLLLRPITERYLQVLKNPVKCKKVKGLT